jgi:hypothetical protein
MPDITKASIGDHHAVAVAAAEVASRMPDYEISAVTTAGEAELVPDGGVAYHWVDSGSGEVFLPAGHVTQEGDGQPLPPSYRRVVTPDDARRAFETLARELDTLPDDVRPIIASLLERHAAHRVGEINSDLTRIRLSGDFATWANDQTAAALRTLLAHADQVGLHEKTEDGWETVLPGDLLISSAASPRRVRGNLRLWRITDRSCDTFPAPYGVRRLRHLRDTAGGCAPGEEPFRRLALSWRLGADGDLLPDDTHNRLNSHAVNIVKRLSRTHVHPDPPVSGHVPQWELYLVIDPRSHGLAGANSAQMHTFPDASDWTRWEVTALEPGDMVVIPPGTAHRGIDVLASVIAIPGFMPTEEVYVDGRIAAETNGAAPHNPMFAGSRAGSTP